MRIGRLLDQDSACMEKVSLEKTLLEEFVIDRIDSMIISFLNFFISKNSFNLVVEQTSIKWVHYIGCHDSNIAYLLGLCESCHGHPPKEKKW